MSDDFIIKIDETARPRRLPGQIYLPIDGEMYVLYCQTKYGTYRIGEHHPLDVEKDSPLYSEYGYIVKKVPIDEILNYEENYKEDVADLNRALKEGRERWE